jgi:hypothetical protein
MPTPETRSPAATALRVVLAVVLVVGGNLLLGGGWEIAVILLGVLLLGGVYGAGLRRMLAKTRNVR